MIRSLLFCLCLGSLFAAPGPAQTLPQNGPNAATSEARLRYWMTSPTADAVTLRAQVVAGPQALADARAALDADGVPMTPEKLQRPLPPPQQNAAPLYTALYPLLNPGIGGGGAIVMAGGLSARYAYTPNQLAAVQKDLNGRRAVIRLIHQAAARPDCVFQRDWARGYETPVKDVWVWRPAVLLLKMEAFLLARQGRYDAAVADTPAGFALARHAGSDPLTFQDGLACDSITLDSLSDILAMAGARPTTDRAVEAVIKANPCRLSLRSDLAGGVALQEIQLQKWRTFLPKLAVWPGGQISNEDPSVRINVDEGMAAAPSPSPTPHPLQSRPLTTEEQAFLHGLFDAEEAESLRQVRPLLQAGDGPDPARRVALVRFQAEALRSDPKSVREIANRIVPGFGGNFSVVNHSDEGLLTYSEYANQLAYLEAEEQVLRASAALLAAKAETGTFPAKLPQEFRDPFTNKPLLYRREGRSGFLVFSFGPGGDTSGEQSADVMRRAHQAGFRYPPPEPEPTPPWMMRE